MKVFELREKYKYIIQGDDKMENKNYIRADEKLCESFRKYSTTNLSDAMDVLGIKGACQHILPIIENKKIVGPAFTLRYIPVGMPIKSKLGTIGNYFEYVKEGDVIVIDNGGRTYCSVWGDIFSLAALKLGVCGTVIDGVCRDIAGIKELDYPVFSKGRFMAAGGKGRVQLNGINVPVSISNVPVNPGDIVVSDDTGVLIVPLKKAKEVLSLAKKVNEKEELIKKAVNEGMPLFTAREKYLT